MIRRKISLGKLIYIDGFRLDCMEIDTVYNNWIYQTSMI